MPQTEYAIQLEHVTKTFGPVIANHDVTMNIRRGEILSLLGENGSGKTTLMNMIAGIYYPDGGQIIVNGQPADIRSPRDALALGIGMIHQHFKTGGCVYRRGKHCPEHGQRRKNLTCAACGTKPVLFAKNTSLRWIWTRKCTR